MRRWVRFLVVNVLMVSVALISVVSQAKEPESILFHLKTSLKHDDAQLCVAYNEIWAALEEGLKVNVLIDAAAVNTYKVGWRGRDSIEGYKLPGRLRTSLAGQFGVLEKDVPSTYGEFLKHLHQEGAIFYVNSTMLLTAGIEELSVQFFRPLSLIEIIRLRQSADSYMVY